MAKLGRPFVYQSAEEKPVTVSLRIPRDLAERMKRYASRHRQSVTDLLLDGLTWRLEQGDPRQQAMTRAASYDNTVLQELAQPVHLIDEGIPFDEDLPSAPGTREAPETPAQPVPERQHYDNTVLQEKASRRPGRPSTMRQPIIGLLRAHPEGLSAVQMKVHLGVDKNIGDTLSGMVRDHLLEKQGNGKAVRYVVRESL
jgi:hypothetical protein